MNMRICLNLIILLFPNSFYAQSSDIFRWQKDSLVVNKSFLYNETSLYKSRLVSPERTTEYKEKNRRGILYSIECLNYVRDDNPLYYDVIRISNRTSGKILLETSGYDETFFAKSLNVTGGASDAPYIKLDLDENAFALIIPGLQYTCSDAAEMMIVVVSDDKADVVFDSPAHVYKYTPYPDYSIEYVVDVDWKMTIGGYVPPASVLNKLKRFKVWQEGNILKYKPLN